MTRRLAAAALLAAALGTVGLSAPASAYPCHTMPLGCIETTRICVRYDTCI